MTAKLVTPIICLFLLLAGPGCAPPPVDVTKPFQGIWLFRDKAPKEVLFDKDICKIVEKKETPGAQVRAEIARVDRSTFQVDPSKNPAEIDFVYIDGANQGKIRPGIFVFEGDKLKICVADIGSPRPAAFVADDNSTLMVLERKQ